MSEVFLNYRERSMGQLVDGQWHDVWYDESNSGAFKRDTFISQLDHGGRVCGAIR
jgi:hypothetical protein